MTIETIITDLPEETQTAILEYISELTAQHATDLNDAVAAESQRQGDAMDLANTAWDRERETHIETTEQLATAIRERDALAGLKQRFEQSVTAALQSGDPATFEEIGQEFVSEAKQSAEEKERAEKMALYQKLGVELGMDATKPAKRS